MPDYTNPNPDNCFECHSVDIVDFWEINGERYGFCGDCVDQWPHESRDVLEAEFLCRVVSWRQILHDEAERAFMGNPTPLHELLG